MTMGLFVVVCCVSTVIVANQVEDNSQTKSYFDIKGDDEDIQFNSFTDVIKIALICCVAAAICGCTGIAGGMVLGPLFMSYGMNA
jgi:hypothetical protein